MSTNKKSEQSNLSTVLRVTSGNFLEMFDFFWLPVMGALSEKVGRKKILLTFTVLPILTVYPIMHRLVANISFENLLVTELWLSFMYASYNGAAVVALTEVMPVHVRTGARQGSCRLIYAANG